LEWLFGRVLWSDWRSCDSGWNHLQPEVKIESENIDEAATELTDSPNTVTFFGSPPNLSIFL
jgi:hypothetical protein